MDEDIRLMLIERIINGGKGRGNITDNTFVSAWARTFLDKKLPIKSMRDRVLTDECTNAELLSLYTNVCLEVFK